jgi:hypothetical protein
MITTSDFTFCMVALATSPTLTLVGKPDASGIDPFILALVHGFVGRPVK